MKKNIYGRQFKRDINERKSLFKGLMTSLVMHDRIQTTEEKAKAIRGSIEKLVTKAKTKGLKATPLLLPYLHKDAVTKMISDIAPRFTNRAGGYTRIMKLGKRFGDDATVVFIEWVEKGKMLVANEAKVAKTKTNKSEKVENTSKIENTAKTQSAIKAAKKIEPKPGKNVNVPKAKMIVKKGDK